MVKITFQITDTPTADTGLDALAYMEGDMQIHLHNTLFVSLPRTLLLDFAGFAQRWLDNHETSPSAYLPMNQEEAVLSIEKAGAGHYRITAANAEKGDFPPVKEEHVAEAFAKFLDELEKELRK
ncbi:hypothetical protein [Chitinophaga barathri]|uniref:DUF7878 domain-containing protein n=1 Tax=Chitinophaga barathri TaxID=1647451 RepID=A0A3N4MCQ8_9BACT|nr:hypothetical protein [Chitinophaga barathri]RPD41702.1 hypothetical protein EG028_05910 [Chitinophaga barathri]